MSDLQDLKGKVKRLEAAFTKELVEELEREITTFQDTTSLGSAEFNDADELLANVARIKMNEEKGSSPVSSDQGIIPAPYTDSSKRGVSLSSSSSRSREEIDPRTKQKLEEADGCFYSGNFRQARDLYRDVLEKYPEYPSALQREKDSVDYMSGAKPVPAQFLPAEAGHIYGQALSASRLEQFDEAEHLLEQANTIVKEGGVRRWAEGEQLRTSLANTKKAMGAYSEAIKKAEQGFWEDALGMLRGAHSLSGHPKFSTAMDFIEKSQAIVNGLSLRGDASSIIQSIENSLDELENLKIPVGWEKVLAKARQQVADTARAKRQIIVDDLKSSFSSKLKPNQITDLEDALKLADDINRIGQTWLRTYSQDQEIRKFVEESSRRIEDLEKVKISKMKLIEKEQDGSWLSLLLTAGSRLAETKKLSRSYPQLADLTDLLKNVERDSILQRIIVGVSVAFIGIVMLYFTSLFWPRFVAAVAPTFTPTFTPTATFTLTPTATATFTPTFTPPPPTLTPTPEQLCFGSFKTSPMVFYDSPGSLTLHFENVDTDVRVKIRTILTDWYKVRYEKGSISFEGWVRASAIAASSCPPPTP